MTETLRWIESSYLGTLIRDTAWIFPALETLHFMGLCVLFGAVLVYDLRLLGWARFIPMRPALAFIPLALGAFAVNLVTGIGFFFADPFRYAPNIAFRWKLVLIALAGLNALWFWISEHDRLKSLPDGADAGGVAKFIAVASLVLWIAVIVFGRMIPYVE